LLVQRRWFPKVVESQRLTTRRSITEVQVWISVAVGALAWLLYSYGLAVASGLEGGSDSSVAWIAAGLAGVGAVALGVAGIRSFKRRSGVAGGLLIAGAALVSWIALVFAKPIV